VFAGGTWAADLTIAPHRAMFTWRFVVNMSSCVWIAAPKRWDAAVITARLRALIMIAPYDIALDLDGNLYISDLENNRIGKVADGVITTVPVGDNGPATLAFRCPLKFRRRFHRSRRWLATTAGDAC
jgi:hypothetical protein